MKTARQPTSSAKRSIGLGGVVLALGIAGATTVTYVRARPTNAAVAAAGRGAATSNEAASNAELTALRSEVERLRAQLDSAEHARVAAAPIGAASARAAQGEPEAKPPTPEQEAAWLSARSTFYDDFFEHEPRDDAWANRMEALARDTTKKQSQTMAVELKDVRCWSSVCRMEFSYPDRSVRMKHIYTLGQQYKDLPAVSYAYPGEPADHTRLVAYMAVDSESFPQFEPQPEQRAN